MAVSDLSPRPLTAPRRRRRWWAVAVLGCLLVAAAWILVQALDSAAVYFYNADEAVAQRDELGDQRFRLQGEVIEVRGGDDEAVRFVVEFNDVRVDVDHSGSQPALFRPGIPVVCEGRWNEAGSAFASDRILVKHSEQYKEENPNRVPSDAP